MDLVFNDKQSVLSDDYLKTLPKEIIDELYDAINNIPFIHAMVDAKRGYAKDRPRDDEGRIIVDLTHPHILEDMDYFRPAALHFKKYGCYTLLRPNSNPNSEFMKWLREEIHRMWYGMVRESDGEWIPGDLYFYWNYSPILQTKLKKGSKKGNRVEDFPEPWDSTYLWSHYIYQAIYGGKYNDYLGGQHFGVIARRGIGKSLFIASMLAKQFIVGENEEVNKSVKNTVVASDKTFLIEDGTLNKFEDMIDFVADHMELPAKRIKSSLADMYWEMGYYDGDNQQIKRGTGNVVVGLSVKDKAGKIRGKRSVRTYFEEFGMFPNFIETYNTALYNAEEGGVSFGSLGFIGCVCAGTKVYNQQHQLVNIENIQQTDTVVGYDVVKHQYTNEPITYIQNAVYKDCVEIKTKKHTLRCSVDHPILTRNLHSKRISGNLRERWFTYDFIPAGQLTTSNKRAVVLAHHPVGVFGTQQLTDAYLIGLLIGDGSYGSNKTPRFSNCDENLLNYVHQHYDCVVERTYLTATKKRYEELRIKGICPMLRQCGIYGQTKNAKRLPVNYLQLTQTDSSDLLAGLFDTDGTVGKNHLAFTSSCYELLEEVKRLLLQFGIQSNICRIKAKILPTRKDKNDWFNLTICNYSNILRFYQNIHLRLTYKLEAIEKYLTRVQKYYRVNDDLYSELILSITPIGKQRVYNLTANQTHTYIANDFVTHNTGGSKASDFSGALEIIYHPEAYNVYPLPNVFDKKAQGKSNTIMFLGAYLNRKLYYDENGNSDVVGALIEILLERLKIKQTASDPTSVTQKKAEMPITIQDCIMKVGTNIYPVADLNDRLMELSSNPHLLDDVYVGKLNLVGGKVEFQSVIDQPIRDFPHKTNKLEGAIEIFKMPEKNKTTGEVFKGRYIAGADVYDNDVADSLSLGSILVLDTFTDQIVCEYTGRPMFADDFYEICRRICLFYNCQLCYENNKKGLYGYFSRTHSTYLLKERLQFLRDTDLAKGESFGNTAYGVTSTVPIKKYASGRIRDWLLKPCTKIVDEQEITYPHLFDLKNVALLKELSLYNLDGNFDRHDALAMLILYREDIYRLTEGTPQNRQQEPDGLERDKFFDRYDQLLEKRNKKYN